MSLLGFKISSLLRLVSFIYPLDHEHFVQPGEEKSALHHQEPPRRLVACRDSVGITSCAMSGRHFDGLLAPFADSNLSPTV